MTPLTRPRPPTPDMLFSATKRQAALTASFYHSHRRFLRFVDTHQKWLLVHLLTAIDNASHPGGGVAVNWISDRAVETGIASRNTTLSFFHQLHAYGYLRKTACSTDRRIMRVSLTREAEGVLADWAMLLLKSGEPDTDARVLSAPQALELYRRMAKLLIAMPQWVNPPLDIRLTQEVRGGWLVMSRIIGQIEENVIDGASLYARNFSVARTADDFSLSRSTLYRLLGKASEAGTMDFLELEGVPALSVNAYHLRQYCRWNGHVLHAAARAFCDRSAPFAGMANIPCPPDQKSRTDLLLQVGT